MQKFSRVNYLYEQSQKCCPYNFFGTLLEKDSLADEYRSYLSNLEKDLSLIENLAWPVFAQKCSQHICNFHPKNHWVNLWNVLNEVKGYIFLKNQGFERLEFLQEKKKHKTPDIKGWSPNGFVLLEVGV